TDPALRGPSLQKIIDASSPAFVSVDTSGTKRSYVTLESVARDAGLLDEPEPEPAPAPEPEPVKAPAKKAAPRKAPAKKAAPKKAAPKPVVVEEVTPVVEEPVSAPTAEVNPFDPGGGE